MNENQQKPGDSLLSLVEKVEDPQEKQQLVTYIGELGQDKGTFSLFLKTMDLTTTFVFSTVQTIKKTMDTHRAAVNDQTDAIKHLESQIHDYRHVTLKRVEQTYKDAAQIAERMEKLPAGAPAGGSIPADLTSRLDKMQKQLAELYALKNTSVVSWPHLFLYATGGLLGGGVAVVGGIILNIVLNH